MDISRPPFAPFDDDTAAQKAGLAEDAWDSRDPARVACWSARYGCQKDLAYG